MHTDDVGTRFAETLDVAFWFFYHQVHIQGFARQLAYRLHHHHPEGEVGYKMPVHHIEVQPVGSCRIEHFDLLCQPRKISGQQGRGYQMFFHLSKLSYICRSYSVCCRWRVQQLAQK